MTKLLKWLDDLKKQVLIVLSPLLVSCFKPKGDPEKRVLIDLREKIDYRRLIYLFTLFAAAGFHIYCVGHFRRRTLTLAKSMWSWHSNTRILWRFRSAKMDPFAIVLTDSPDLYLPTHKSSIKKLMRLYYDFIPRMRLEANHYVMPLLFHVQMYRQYHVEKRFGEYRANKKKIRILHGGNWGRDYNNYFIENVFYKVPRSKVLDFLVHHEKARLVKCDEELDAVLNGDFCNELVILDESYRVNQERWMAVVSASDFLLSLPGVLIPMATSSVEALSVGTIPIIDFAEYFVPELENRKNCVQYHTLKQLGEIINTLFQVELSTLEHMRQDVIRYYEEYLEPKGFVDRLMNSHAEILHLHVDIEEPKFYARAINRAMETREDQRS